MERTRAGREGEESEMRVKEGRRVMRKRKEQGKEGEYERRRTGEGEDERKRFKQVDIKDTNIKTATNQTHLPLSKRCHERTSARQ